jgi:arsenate reductase
VTDRDRGLRKVAAELLGTAFLMLAIVGSGITASADGAASTQLFQHAVIVGTALAALILTFGPVSGAHFNPAVTIADTVFGGLDRALAARYVVAQVVGAIGGTVLANVLFDQPVVALATTDRTGVALAGSEVVATFGLLMVIFGIVRSDNLRAVPAAVGAYIAAAIYFTSSASFANPAVTLARMFTDTYTGIAPASVGPFLTAQLVGTGLAVLVIRWLFHPDVFDAANVVVPHAEPAVGQEPAALVEEHAP